MLESDPRPSVIPAPTLYGSTILQERWYWWRTIPSQTQFMCLYSTHTQDFVKSKRTVRAVAALNSQTR